MKMFLSLVKRNSKIFFKDKAMFFSSMITPIIIILLFITFLGNVYRDSFNNSFPEGFTLSKKIIEGFVGGWLFSSLFATSCVTISFCSNLLMVQDKATKTIIDIEITPVKKSVMSLSYFVSAAFVTLIVCYVALIVGFIYLGIVGWYLSFLDVILIIIDIFLLVLFGTALSSIIHFFLETQGQMSVVGTLVSTIYGFICGAYMPISQFGSGLQKVLMFLPGTYSTSLIHKHFLGGVLNEMEDKGVPKENIEGITKSFDIDLNFFGHNVSEGVCYLVIILSILGLIGIYILLNVFLKKRKK